MVSDVSYPNQSVMYQLLPHCTSNFWTQLQNSSESIHTYILYVALLKTKHELFKIPINREDLVS